MSNRMFRRSDVITATIAKDAALSGAFDFSFYSEMVITLPAVWTAADIGFYVSTTLAGTFTPLYDSEAVLVEIGTPIASESIAAPAGVAGARFVKIWSESGAVDAAQAAARVLTITMKA